MAFLRVFAVAAVAALIGGAAANPGYGWAPAFSGFAPAFGGFAPAFAGYGPAALGPAIGLPGVDASYGVLNIPNVLGSAGLGVSHGGSEITLPGYVPHATLPAAATYAVPNSVALPPGLHLPCGVNVPGGLSVPVGLPFAGQPVALNL